LLNNVQAERRTETKQLNDANNLLTRERNVARDLQEILNKNKTRLKEFESALEKERTQNTVIQYV
jgi:predicted  nucleic acid-binding Zn-ribbon protein